MCAKTAKPGSGSPDYDGAFEKRQSPELECLEPRIMLDATSLEVMDGLDDYLGLFADSMEDNVLAVRMPLLGDGLSESIDFIHEMQDVLFEAYTDLDALENPNNPTPGNDFIRQVVYEAWATRKQLLVDTSGDPIANWQSIEVLDVAGLVQFNCHLRVDIYTFDTAFDVEESLDFDIGFDIFSVDISGEVFFQVGFDWQLNFGQIKDANGDPAEFYVDANAEARPGAGGEMEFSVEAAIPDLQAEGTFLHLGAGVTDEDADEDETNNGLDLDGDGLLPSQFKVVFDIDVIDVNTDTFLTRTEFNSVATAADIVDAHVTGGLHRDILGYAAVADYCLIDLNLNLELNFGGAEEMLTFGDEDTGDMQMPHLSADFRLAWFLFDRDIIRNDESGEFEFGPDPLDNIPVVEFNHISLHLGQFISQFAGPVLKGYQLLTTPVRPLIDWFNMPIPIISDLANDDSLTLAKIAGFAPKIGPVITALNQMAQAVQYAEAFPADEDITFDFGSFQFFGDFRAMNELKDDAQNIINNTLSWLPLEVSDNITQSMHDFLTSGSGTTDPVGLSFPIMTNPGEIVRFILGGDASLVEFIVPPLEVDFHYGASFPIFPPFLNVGFSGDIEVALRLGFGFDTYGIRKYAESDNEADLFQGFYLKDEWTSSQTGLQEDLPEVYLSLGIGAKAFAGIPGLIEGGARGGISADIGLNFSDIDGDGRMRFGELAQHLSHGTFCFFDGGGSLSAFLEAYVWVGLDLGLFEITIFEDSWTIASGDIVSYGWNCPINEIPPRLASLAADGSGILTNGDIVPAGTAGAYGLPDGTLVLNMGPRSDNLADSGYLGSIEDRSQSFTISQETVEVAEDVWQEMIVVKALGFEEYYDPAQVNHIYAEGGAGKDVIRILNSVTTTGTDGVAATARLYGDFRTDVDMGPEPVIDGDADDGIRNEDKLYLGPGGGWLFGGPGSDRLRGSDIDDVMYGGSGDDHLVGYDGNDLLYGGSNEDTLRGDNGDDELHGGSQNDRLYGRRDDDLLYGDAGDDLIKGGSGEDVLRGGSGDDKLLGNGSVDLLYGESGNDILDGGTDNDWLWGGAGSDSLHAGAGFDVLYGGTGNDMLIGDDAIFSQTGEITLTGQGQPSAGILWDASLYDAEIEDEDLREEVANSLFEDLLFGHEGDDRLVVGWGNDLAAGNGGDDVYQAVSIYESDGNDPVLLAGDVAPDPTYYATLIDTAGNDTVDLSRSAYGVVLDLAFREGKPQTIDPAANALVWYGQYENAIGSEFDDVLLGSRADNRMYGLGGEDRLLGLAGDDMLDGGDGVDRLLGGVDQDLLRGGSGDDVLRGGLGSDRLAGEAGADDMDGGPAQVGDVIWVGWPETLLASDIIGYNGTRNRQRPQPNDDIVDYSFDVGGVLVDLAERTATDGYGDIDEFRRVVGVYGSAFNDNLLGSRRKDIIRPNGGDDTVDAGGGGDTIQWAPGDGIDNVQGGRGRDVWVYMGTGDTDYVLVSQDIESVRIERVGQPGHAAYIQGVETVSLETAGGDDVAEVLPLTTRDVRKVVMDLGAGDDLLLGSEANVGLQASGGSGDDTFIGGGGSDRFDGGEGDDRVDYSGAPAAVNARLDGRGVSDGRGGRDRISKVETLQGSQFDDKLAGGRRADTIYGGPGDDVLRGGGGGDWLFGQEGADVIDGGGGVDLLDYSNWSAAPASGWAAQVNLGAGTANDMHGFSDRIRGIEGAIGSPFGDELIGDRRGNVFYGGGGNDLLSGLAGRDRLDGQGGDDEVLGGKGGGDRILWRVGDGDDVIDAGMRGRDALWVYGSDGVDVLTLAAGAAQQIQLTTGGAGGFGAMGALDVRVFAGDGDDSVYVEAFQSAVLPLVALHLGDGDDLLWAPDANVGLDAFGEAGDDTFTGGAGNDLFDGGDGFDSAEYVAAPSGVYLTGRGAREDGYGSKDEFGSIERLVGSQFDDTLIASGDVVEMDGGFGNDDERWP